MASMEPEAVVATVARRFDVTRQQVYDWRRAARRGDLGTPGGVFGFVEVVAETPAHGAATEAEAAPIARTPESVTTAVDAVKAATVTVEIVLIGGRVLRAPTALSAAELRRLIGAVEGA